MEKPSFTAKEMDGGFVSGNYVVEKLNHYPADIISLLDADKIKAYERFSIPATSFQQEAKYWKMWHWEAKKLTVENVPGLYFSRKEIENLDTEENLQETPPGWKDVYPSLVEYDNIFQKSGNDWLVRFRGCEPVRMRNHKNIRYIIHLLDNMNRELSPVELRSLVDGKPIERTFEDEEAFKEALRKETITTDRPTEELSYTDKNEYKETMLDLWLKHGPGEVWEKAKKEFSKEHGHVIEQPGRDPEFRFYKNNAEDVKLASNLAHNSIKGALKKIKVKLPDLYYHLEEKNRIQPGNNSYIQDPEDPVDWVIKR